MAKTKAEEPNENRIKLSDSDIERLTEILVKPQIDALRADLEETLTQVLSYMNELHTHIETLSGEPIVNYTLAHDLKLGRQIQLAARKLNIELPATLRGPDGMDAQPSAIMKATGNA